MKISNHKNCFADIYPPKIVLVIFGLFSLLFFLVVSLNRQSLGAAPDCIKTNIVFTQEKNPPCQWCTQIYFTPTEEILISSRNSTIFWRANEKEAFTAVPLSLLHPHSILYNPDDRLYYLNDTDNNRILALSSLKHGKIEKEITSIAGIKLIRPHDIVRDPATGWLYTINPHDPIVFRFNKSEKNVSFLDLSNELGYSRALTFVNNKLYVAGSSDGKIIEIINFDQGKYKVYQSAGKKTPASSGDWQTNGLIINDVDFFRGYWYVSSYFHSSTSNLNQNHNKNKLIRFREWDDFTSGNWQDLSSLLPGDLTPYYLSTKKDKLYIAMFNHQYPGHGDSIYELTAFCPSPTPALLPILK